MSVGSSFEGGGTLGGAPNDLQVLSLARRCLATSDSVLAMAAEAEKDGAERAEEAVVEKSGEKDAAEGADADEDAVGQGEAEKDAVEEAEIEKAPAADGKDTPAQDTSPATEGKRRRRPTERMLEEPAEDRKRKQPKLTDGEGVPLGELAVFAAGLKKQDMILLRKLHRVLYNTQGSQKNIRQVLRKFRGFTFQNDAEEQKKLAQIEKHSRADLNVFCQLVGLSHRKDKHETSVALLEFLKRPSEENSRAPRAKKPVSRPSKKASARKPSRGRKSDSMDDSYYAKFIREERKNVKEQHPDASETELIFLCGAEFGKKYEVVIDEDGESDAKEEPEDDAAEEEDDGDAEAEAKDGENDGDAQEGEDADATAQDEAE